MPSYSEPSLYGLDRSNRQGRALWGKNQFNSTFPISLCCYMWDHGIPPVYLELSKDFEVTQNTSTSFHQIFQVERSVIHFDFEESFEPYSTFLYDEIDRIDLIVKNASDPEMLVPIRPFEVKLTVLPDSTTCGKANESEWGSELVIRPVSSSYAMLSIVNKIKQHGGNDEARDIIEGVSSSISNWENEAEIIGKSEIIIDALATYLARFSDYQSPFLIQPIWKTVGQEPILADYCFDVFVWSDFCLFKAILDAAHGSLNRRGIARSLRECVRMLKCLYDLHTRGRVNLRETYRTMAFGKQTDKAIAFSGRSTHQYMKSDRLSKPILKKEVVKEIILNGGENELSPERRFDATIYFTCRNT